MTTHPQEPYELPRPANHNHGKTTAAWVANGGITAGTVAAGVGLMIPDATTVWVGVGVIVVALAAGAVLRTLGHGQPLIK